MYLAIARKWRPQRFEDLVGQEHVVQTLMNAIRLKRVAHAYLFSGARGVGKTSVARIFAKALRCPNVKGAIPCNECAECQAVSEGRAVDVVEIDGASNNGVESVRAIRENVAYGAAAGFYKIYIIDEVHMLSVSAFNALLKTLEEPPSHVIFLFATTEPQKIPLTILSRCQRFEFRRLTQSQLIGRLAEISKKEGRELDQPALRAIATQADGSLRDALSLLDQVFSFFASDKGDSILTEAEVISALGISQVTHVSKWLALVVHKDVAGLLALIGEVHSSGVDLKHFAERCLEEVRLLYLIRVALEGKAELTAESLDIAATQHQALTELAKSVTLPQVERISQILLKTAGDLSWATLPRFVLEMASVRMSELDGFEIETVSAAVPAAVPAKEVPASGPPPVSVSSASPVSSSDQGWKSFVDAVMKKRPLLGALLSHAKFRMETTSGGKRVVLSFAEGSFYERQATEKRNRTEIESLLKSHFGPQTELALTNLSEGVEPSLEQKHQSQIAEIKQQAINHPVVQKSKELLGAEIVDVSVE